MEQMMHVADKTTIIKQNTSMARKEAVSVNMCIISYKFRNKYYKKYKKKHTHKRREKMC